LKSGQRKSKKGGEKRIRNALRRCSLGGKGTNPRGGVAFREKIRAWTRSSLEYAAAGTKREDGALGFRGEREKKTRVP